MTLFKACFKCDSPHAEEHAWCSDCRRRVNGLYEDERRLMLVEVRGAAYCVDDEDAIRTSLVDE